MSGRPSTGRRNPIWKLRDKVAKAPTRSTCRAAGLFQHPDQFLARGEDRVGVVERDAAGLGQEQLLATPLEQRMTELRLQLLDLDRQCRLRDIQPFGRAR